MPLMGITEPTPQETAIVAASVRRAHTLIRNYLQYDPAYGLRTEYYPQQDHSQMHAGGVWEVNDQQAYYRRFATQGWGLMHLKELPVRGVTIASGTVGSSPAPTRNGFTPTGGYAGSIPAVGSMLISGNIPVAFTFAGGVVTFVTPLGTAPTAGAAWSVTTPTVWIDYDGRSGQMPGSFSPGTVYPASGGTWWANFDIVADSLGNPVCSDGMLVNIGQWPTEVGSVKVSYFSGYLAAEFAGTDPILDASPIFEACCVEAVRATRRALLLMKRPIGSPIGLPGGVIESEGLGDYRYSVAAEKTMFGTGTISAEACQLLSQFYSWGYNISP
jgi:hypothetical protein